MIFFCPLLSPVVAKRKYNRLFCMFKYKYLRVWIVLCMYWYTYVCHIRIACVFHDYLTQTLGSCSSGGTSNQRTL